VSLNGILAVVSSLCFLIYGTQCLISSRMASEFERYGVPQLRQLTGLLEVLAGIGLLVGLRWPPAMTASSGGLFLMMVAALVVRVRIKDGIVQSLPAFGLMALNGFLFVASLR